MEISKYLKTDKEISNDDLDFDKLTTDIKKGLEKEVKTQFESDLKSRESEFSQKEKELTEKIANMQNEYDILANKYSEQSSVVNRKNMEVAMLSQGFKQENFDEVEKLRTSIYGDIADDTEAVQKVKEHFGKVYFQETPKFAQAPEESNFNKVDEKPKSNIVVNRNTNIKDLIKVKEN